MKEQLAKLIAELDKEMAGYREEAQEMLDNSDVNHDIEDAEEFGNLQGKAEIIEEIIERLKSL